MPMFVEAALVTRKAASSEFNTDSINASGKTWPRETVHGEKGIRAVGTGREVPYYVLAGSPVKGTAESAADLFKSCTQIFAPDMANAPDVIADFYASFAKVLNDAGYASSDCELEVFCGFRDKVILAKSGNSRIFRINDEQINEVLPSMSLFADEKSSYGVSAISGVSVGEIFVLINSSVAAVLPEDLIKAVAVSANGDIKKIVSVLASQADKYGCCGAVSAIAVRISETETAPVVVKAEETAADDEAEPQSAVAESSDDISSDNNDIRAQQDDKEDKPKGKVAFGIVIAIFLLFLVVLGFLAGRGIAKRHELDETTTEESTSAEETESETEEETTGEITTEESTTEETTAEEGTSIAEETSARTETTTRTVTTTAAPESTREPDTSENVQTEVPSAESTDAEEPSEENTTAETEENDPTEEPATADEPENEEDTGTGEKEEVLG